MNLLGWLTGRWSARARAMLLYRRGMLKAKLRDHAAAVADYTAVVEMSDAPADVRAMALYNRSLVHAASRHDPLAIDDLETLIEMDGATAKVKTEARRKLVRMQRSDERSSAADG